MNRAIIDDGYPIKPRMIDASKHMFDAFGRMETEVSAGYIVRAFQDRETETGESWDVPLDEKALKKAQEAAGFVGEFYYNGLDALNLIFIKDGKVTVAHLFVAKCFESSPVSNWVGGKYHEEEKL